MKYSAISKTINKQTMQIVHLLHGSVARDPDFVILIPYMHRAYCQRDFRIVSSKRGCGEKVGGCL